MMKFVSSALKDADILLFVVDIDDNETVTEEFLEKLKGFGPKVLVVINKIDLADQKILEVANEKWKALLPEAEVIPASALNSFNVSYLFDRILALLPESPPYFDKDALTDKPEKFFVSEIIREKILMYYQKEIPYSTEVVVQSFKDTEDIIRIAAEIMVERDSQKGIIIGHQGKSLKKVGTEARKDMEQFLGKKVFLELFVKVDKDWRNRDSQLRRYGYDSN
jgi:GTP-binding protein Era